MTSSLLLLVVAGISCAVSQDSMLPARISPAVLSTEVTGQCPANEINSRIEDLKEEIAEVLRNITTNSNCPCGGPGQWTKIADLNFSDPSVACPDGFRLITTSVRGCGRQVGEVGSCKSISFSSDGLSYSRVCGRINAYQKGSPDAFHFDARSSFTVEGNYVDGISLTHGAAGSRQHIWTFAASVYETDPHYRPQSNCACTNTDVDWPYQVPSFIGDDYFCATGNPGPGNSLSPIDSDDPLWDGEGCGPTNACCQLNNPPWFCTTLPQPTTDDIEMRVCQNEGETNEDTILSLVDISIM